MLDIINNKLSIKEEHISKYREEMISEYYTQYFNELSSKNLDKEFNKDLSLLIKSMSKLSKEDRNKLMNTISTLIEFYVNTKVEKELEYSFNKLFKHL